MNMQGFGARNIQGFQSQASVGYLPKPTHISYEGVFNQIKFDVGSKTHEVTDLHFGYARYQFAKSLHDSNINDYLAFFVKGRQDGQDRDERSINVLICLDISGSMRGGLGQYHGKQFKNRLDLSKEAIKMFISKLRPNDSVGMVTFNNQAQTIFQPTSKYQIKEDVYQTINNIQASGGTTIRSGFQASKKLLTRWIQDHESKNCQNRIILLTDVSDNCLSEEKVFIQEASIDSNIHLTIIGISSDFKSNVCENLKNVRGFNYFCAVNDDDIKKYVFQTFDFGYFPSAFDINIEISSEDIDRFQVFGAPDSDLVANYNNNFVENQTSYKITKLKSAFPSEIEIIGTKIYTYGGLILVKLQRKTKNPFFKGEITLQYSDPFGKSYQQKYSLHYEFHSQEQFFSEQSLIQAIEGFIFTFEMKNLLTDSNNMPKIQTYKKYSPILMDLEKIVPKCKAKSLENIVKIISSYNTQKQ